MNTTSIFKSMNFDFGKIEDGSVAYSVKGIAVGLNKEIAIKEDCEEGVGRYGRARKIEKQSNRYLTYCNNEIIDVTDLIIRDIPLYKMPVAIKDIVAGDMVLHQGQAVVVKSVNKDGTLVIVNVVDATQATIFPIKNIFGFNFYTKIVNLFANTLGGLNENNPFGSMPFMFMLANNNSEEGSSFSDLMLLSMMQNNSNNFGIDNSMLPLLMAGNSNDKSGLFFALSMMQNQNQNIAQQKQEEK